ncbi:uncharacterized protein VTP21DRAFT_5137 [Calcarisporiella thermophila]|uniref:uncharacterized protein n=1 Tax=Calcarisporiella thermophila TaxID=911321 RepID=UPI0037429A05
MERVAIIGAGASGLTSIKQCLEEGFEDIVCFEQNEFIGGLWHYTEIDDTNNDPHSSIYRSTIINTSRQIMSYSDFPVPENWPVFLPNQMVARYFDMYAEHFELIQYIRFKTKVTQLEQLSDERWKIHYIQNGSEEKAEIFDYVMIASGHHRVPRWPNFEGMEQYEGRQMHSHFYRLPYTFEGKSVLVVGIGNSGVDISTELSLHAKQVYLSSRRGTWVTPRILLGKPIGHQINRFTTSLIPRNIMSSFMEKLLETIQPIPPGPLRPKHGYYAAHPTIKSDLIEHVHAGRIIPKPNVRRFLRTRSIQFDDGTVVDDIDVVIYCTGYHIRFGFLKEEVLTADRPDVDLEQNQVWLWRNMYPLHHKNLVFIGLIQPLTAIMPISELQARYATNVWKKRAWVRPPPDKEHMNRDIQAYLNDQQQLYALSPRHTIQLQNALGYMDLFAKDLGCYPYLKDLVAEYGIRDSFRLLLLLYFGLPVSTQYRLVGHGKWREARVVLEKYWQSDGMSKTLLDEASISNTMREWWDSGNANSR